MGLRASAATFATASAIVLFGACGLSPGFGPFPEEDVCTDGLTRCGNRCVRIYDDPLHCGACDASCADDQTCANGACDAICEAPLVLCTGACEDLASDRSNCGVCGRSCGSEEVCDSGRCADPCRDDADCGQAEPDASQVETSPHRAIGVDSRQYVAQIFEPLRDGRLIRTDVLVRGSRGGNLVTFEIQTGDDPLAGDVIASAAIRVEEEELWYRIDWPRPALLEAGHPYMLTARIIDGFGCQRDARDLCATVWWRDLMMSDGAIRTWVSVDFGETYESSAFSRTYRHWTAPAICDEGVCR